MDLTLIWIKVSTILLSIIQVQRNRNLKLPMATVVFISMTIYCLPEKIQRHSNLMYPKIFLISPQKYELITMEKEIFYLKSVQLEPLKKSFIPLLYVLCFVLSSLLCFFVFRSGKKLRGLAIGYIAFHYIVLYPIMSKGLISIGLTFQLQLL